MNKSEFIQLIQAPELLTAKQVAALKQVVADFPYFTGSQVLLAKALFNEKHYEADKYLKQTALAVPDREVLYNYLHDIKTEAAPQVVAPAPVTEPPPPVPRTSEEAPPAPLPANEADTRQEEEIRNGPVPPVVTAEEEIPALQVMQPEPLAPDHGQEAKEPGETAEEPVQENTGISGEVPLNETGDPVETALPRIPEQPSPEPVEEAPAPGNETAGKPTLPAGNETHSFMEWLQLASGRGMDKVVTATSPVKQEESRPEEIPVDKEPDQPELAVPSAGNPATEVTREEIERSVARSNVNDFGAILDKFIRENPSISRPKAEFFNPVNMARQSVEEDDELVTETLAGLYYKQGNLRKAIRAYEKLCLLYPSKMTYFASLIQKIKTELKD